MFHRLLSSDPTRFAELGEVGLYALIGFLVVFVGIAFLIFVVWAVGKFMANSKEALNVSPKKEKTVESKVEISPKEDLMTAEDEITEETVAIITAAIMAYYEKNNPKCEFTVKRIKRI